jgi:hypothetical protein
MKAQPTISAPSRSISRIPASAVPPVARRSSTRSTFSPGLERVVVDLDDGLAVFELVILTDRRAGQLALLADRHEAHGQLMRDGAAEDEPPRLEPHDLVDPVRPA